MKNEIEIEIEKLRETYLNAKMRILQEFPQCAWQEEGILDFAVNASVGILGRTVRTTTGHVLPHGSLCLVGPANPLTFYKEDRIEIVEAVTIFSEDSGDIATVVPASYLN